MRQSHARIQAVKTGRTATRGPVDTHTRNVLAITKRIHTLQRRTKTLRQQLRELGAELRAAKRELRAVLQRDSRVTEDAAPLQLAGTADAIDASEHRREQHHHQDEPATTPEAARDDIAAALGPFTDTDKEIDQ